MRGRIMNHYLAFFGIRDEKELTEKVLRDVDTWLTPEEAVAHGIADAAERPQPKGMILSSSIMG